jgi:hypothetical protein
MMIIRDRPAEDDLSVKGGAQNRDHPANLDLINKENKTVLDLSLHFAGIQGIPLRIEGGKMVAVVGVLCKHSPPVVPHPESLVVPVPGPTQPLGVSTRLLPWTQLPCSGQMGEGDSDV